MDLDKITIDDAHYQIALLEETECCLSIHDHHTLEILRERVNCFSNARWKPLDSEKARLKQSSQAQFLEECEAYNETYVKSEQYSMLSSLPLSNNYKKN